MKAGFENPPNSALPLVWWHWTGGNITKEGVKLDIDWMHRAGIGGFQAFEASMGTPAVVNPPVTYMSPEWKDAFKEAIGDGNKYGMEMAVAGSPGWSEAGGPWVKPANAMKKIVWTETRIGGGQAFHGKLRRPPATVGPFQNVPASLSFVSFNPTFPEYYADSEVIAYRAPANDLPLDSVHPRITASSGEIDSSLLSDGDFVKPVLLPIAPVGRQSWIQYEFSGPQTIQAISLAMAPPRAGNSNPSTTPVLEASDNGVDFRTVTKIDSLKLGYAPRGNVTQTTVAFPPVKARFYRIVWTTPEPIPQQASPGFGMSSLQAKPQTNYEIAELILSAGARVNHFEEKVGFSTAPDLSDQPTPNGEPASAVSKDGVIILTGRMQPDGTLDWTPPSGGDWVVLRFGYSLTGAKDAPAPPEATGLEVDKFDHMAVKEYLEHYLDMFKEAAGPDLVGKHGLRFVVNDSWEAGNQTWTADMVAKFTRLRGYDPRPWMPVLAGRVVESSEASDRFLWDYRKTIADLIATEFYGQLESTLHAYGLGHYSESHEDSRGFVGDGMEVKKYSEVPMGAMWVERPGVYDKQFHFDADDRESASVAHIYGQNLAAAESLTTCDPSNAWAWWPATLKPTADQEFLNGINRIAIHESAHQPLIGKAPGVTVGPCGQWFNRNETWAEQARAWTQYLARNSFLLQQGKFAADVLYFYGEDTNITSRFEDSAPDIPSGYNFDYINPDGLINALSVADGNITTRSGMSYRVLVIDSKEHHMSLPVLHAIYRLVQDGAVVVAQKPVETPSLADDRVEFKRLNDELFGFQNGTHSLGRGRVYVGDSLENVLQALRIAPDFECADAADQKRIRFIHRRIDDGDLYFVDNQSDSEANFVASFRVAGKGAELWYSETGTTAPASFSIASGHTDLPLALEPWGSVFVVFRKTAATKSFVIPKTTATVLATVSGPWNLEFQQGRGAPNSVPLDRLMPWNESPDNGVRYFSGIGTYRTTIHTEAGWFRKGASYWLDLGEVKNLAVVTVNGREVGTSWHKPFRVDITSALKPGTNEITIQVVNTWVNRLIGDRQQDVTTKYTFATWPGYTKESPLQTSGLIGPVTVVRETRSANSH